MLAEAHFQRVAQQICNLVGCDSVDVPGAGLGLYITHKLVEAMGGSVTVCSREGEGTSVTFTLPVEPTGSVIG